MDTDRRKESVVAAAYCGSYDEEEVYNAVKACTDALGGIAAFVRRDEKILVKPNFLTASDPELAIVTHPSVTGAVLRLLHEEGCTNVVCGDSPGHGSPESAAEKAGLPELFNRYGARQADMSTEVSVDYPGGAAADRFYLTKDAAEADAIIGVCKMKTHALERITGAVKNMYGLVCGYRKAAGHVRFPNAVIFARMLADIHNLRKPRLHIMDGIVAMEGNGPGSGDPVQMNIILASADPVALDTVFCQLINMDPELIPTNVQGELLGVGCSHLDKIRIIETEPAAAKNRGEREISADELFKKYGKADFDADRTGTKKTLLSRFSDAMTAIARRPFISAELCVKCGICVEHCPVPGKAVSFKNGKTEPPVYDYSKCIRCYCCQEMCPQNAIKVKGHGR